MKLLAIDPGYDKLGYSFFMKEKSTPELITSGLLRSSKTLPAGQRLLHLHFELTQLIKKHTPDTMAVEKLFFAKNVKTVMQVSQAIGMILMTGAQHNLELIELTPLQIKQIITGYGNADKKAVQKMLWLQLGREIKVEDDDESDAIACGLAACILNRSL